MNTADNLKAKGQTGDKDNAGAVIYSVYCGSGELTV